MTKQLPHITVLCLLLRYDEASGKLFWRRRHRAFFEDDRAWSCWNSRYADQPAFVHGDKQGYFRGSVMGQLYAAHRVVWKMATCQEPDQIDHIDGDRTNNRLSNLRSVTNADNCRNRGVRSDNTSGHPGVYRRRNKWEARIFINGQDIPLGRFTDIADAIAARRAAEAEHGYHENHGMRPAYGYVPQERAA